MKRSLYNLVCFILTLVLTIVFWEYFKFFFLDKPQLAIITRETQLIKLGDMEAFAIFDACEKVYVERTKKEWDGFCHKEDGFELFLEPVDGDEIINT